MSGYVLPPGSRSKIYHDLEVRAALDELLRQPLTTDEMWDRLHVRFGDGRTPSRTAIGRYARRRRLEIGFDTADYFRGRPPNT
ncbi:MAG: hypothetical protein Kow00114_25190 [Kiloniellaceae bacterium]